MPARRTLRIFYYSWDNFAAWGMPMHTDAMEEDITSYEDLIHILKNVGRNKSVETFVHRGDRVQILNYTQGEWYPSNGCFLWPKMCKKDTIEVNTWHGHSTHF